MSRSSKLSFRVGLNRFRVVYLSFSLIGFVLFCCSVEYNVSYVYHALYAYFDRDNVALKGLAK